MALTFNGGVEQEQAPAVCVLEFPLRNLGWVSTYLVTY